jgi:hypothetical protein
MDFTQRAADAATAEINAILCPLIDERLAATAKAVYDLGRGSGEGDVAFKRIGAGYIGIECERELAFRYHKLELDVRGCDGGGTNPGELQRHAEAGHWTEDMTANWLTLADIFMIRSRDEWEGKPLSPEDAGGDFKQIGWLAAPDSKGQARLAGEVDGIIQKVLEPRLAKLIKPPCIWESKKATDKKWKKFVKEGIAKAEPRYWGQLHVNMAFMGMTQTLFSMLNLDNMKFYFELVQFDERLAQRLTNRAFGIFNTTSPFELPRLGRTVDDFVCQFCNFKKQCWHETIVAPTPTKIGGFNPNAMQDPPF